MEERVVDSCFFVEDLQGPSKEYVIRVAQADVKRDGSLARPYTKDPDGVPTCTACGFRVTLHRRQPAALPAFVPPLPARSVPARRTLTSQKPMQSQL